MRPAPQVPGSSVRASTSSQVPASSPRLVADTPSPAPRAAEVREALHHLLSSGRAVSTSELRIRLQDSGLPHVTHEAVYKQLVLLAGRGLLRKLGRCNGRRHVFWAAIPTACGSEGTSTQGRMTPDRPVLVPEEVGR